MTSVDDVKRKFPNHRQWRDFVAAVHDSVTEPCVVTYPNVIGALRSSRAWFNDAGSETLSLERMKT